jgi:hypothetical protein
MAAKTKATGPAFRGRPTQGVAATPSTGKSLAGGTAKPGGMTKMDGVKQALAELGSGAKPLQIRDHLKRRFNIDISPDVASNYKKVIAKKAAKAKARPAANRGQPAAPQPASGTQSPPASVPKVKATVPRAAGDGKATGSIRLEDIQAVKELVGRVGAGPLRSLVDLLAR